jgi:beta-N-acetylhexosaminidase
MNIGALIIRGFSNRCINTIIHDLKNFSLGGVIFFKSNFIKEDEPIPFYFSYEETQEYLKRFPSQAFLSIDCEGKNVNRFNHLFELKKTEDLKTLSKSEMLFYVKQKAKLLKNLGINVNFAPCVDKFYPKSFIGQRSFSGNVDELIGLASLYLEEFSKESIYTCLKHFPGHGSASSESDSHEDIFYLDKYVEDEIRPFLELEAPFLMTTHIKTPLNPNEIATFSKDVIEEYLSDYKGLIITDDLHMGALLEYTLEERVLKSLQSGHDILLFSQQDFASQGRFKKKYPEEFEDNLHNQIIEIIEKALKKGTLSKESIELKIEKIKKLRSKL